jgi:hypothetical protein
MWAIHATKLILICILTLAASEGVAANDSFHNFQAAYRCDVLERLKLIYATGDPRKPLNRYLVISGPGHDYVQCIFHDSNSRVRCEASSGFWTTKPGRARTVYQTPRAIAALASLGFGTDDSAGNFRAERSIGAPADFGSLADFMLRALHDGYGVRSDTKLTFKAPFAPNRPATCVPLS